MSPILDGLGRAFATIRRGAVVAAGLAVIAMTLLGTADVAGRFLLQRPLLAQVELTRILLVYVAFLGLAEAENAGGHVRLRILDSVLSERRRFLRDCAIGALAVGTAGLATVSAAVFFWDSWSVAETMIAPIPLPAWLAKLGIVIGFLLFSLELLLALLRRLSEWNRPA